MLLTLTLFPMESTEPQPARVRPPWVVIVVMAFLGYAAFVALPFLVLGPPTGQALTAVLVTLSFATFFSLWLLGRWRLTFHLARTTLALWAASGVYAALRMIVAPWFSAARPQSPVVQVLMVLGVGAICGLFWLYGFGRRTRVFYGRTPYPRIAATKPV